MTLHEVLQALVFASPKPISVGELVAALKGAGESCESLDAQALSGMGGKEVEAALGEVRAGLESAGSPFRLVEGASGWSFVTCSEYAPWVRQLYPEAKPTRLSGPALETLAIIAYRQPVTRADMEAVRGVSVDGVMQVLLDRGLVKISGRAELPGRPLLYSTTAYFLEHFGLKSTGDLPNADELRRIDLPKAPSPEEKAGKKKERLMEGIEAGAGGPQPEVEKEGEPGEKTSEGGSLEG
ncbi:MAG: SMC-Scp complex subunit ScpB [Verrucomicrobiota bacterium]|jgi:segregation and condensation protein B